MKKILCVLFIAVLVITNVNLEPVFDNVVHAETVTTSDGFVFDKSTGTITGYTGTGGKITIPSSIDEVDVIAIGKRAFKECTLTEATISEGIVTIGEWAFSNNAIISVTLPTTLVTIEDNAFYDNLLTAIMFREGLKTIGSGAFSYNQLTQVVLPGSIRYVGDEAFCQNSITDFTLPSITDTGFVSWYTSYGNKIIYSTVTDLISGYVAVYDYTIKDEDVEVVDGIITSYEFDGTGYEGGYHPLYITIPSELDGQVITGIGGELVFWGEQLVHVNLPSTLTYIGNNAFSNNYLTQIELPQRLLTMDVGAFAINRLTHVTLPDGLEEVLGSVFSNNYLRDITIPDSVKVIGRYSFADNSISQVTMGSGIEKIGDRAFRNNSLSSFDIPATVKYIGSEILSGNSASTFTLPTFTEPEFMYWTNGDLRPMGGETVNDSTNPYIAVFQYTLSDDDVVVVDGELISYTYDEDRYLGASEPIYLIMPEVLDSQSITKIPDELFRDKGLFYIDLPDSIEEIGYAAFRENSLTEIELPSSLKSLGMGAFYSNNIDDVTIPTGVTFIGSHAFYDNSITSFVLTNPGGYFVYWEDSLGNEYDAGETVTELNRSYTAIFKIYADEIIVDDVVVKIQEMAELIPEVTPVDAVFSFSVVDTSIATYDGEFVYSNNPGLTQIVFTSDDLEVICNVLVIDLYINDDSVIDMLDLVEVAQNYSINSNFPYFDSKYDINCDEVINIYDLIYIARELSE